MPNLRIADQAGERGKGGDRGLDLSRSRDLGMRRHRADAHAATADRDPGKSWQRGQINDGGRRR
jgi:hypothetical protein